VRRRGRAALVAFAALVAVAGCGDAPAGPVTASPSAVATPPEPVSTATATATAKATAKATARPCPPDGVLVTAGPVDGALGLRAVTLRLTNCGRSSYTVAGYPDVAVLDDAGRRVPVDVTRGARAGDPVEDPGPATTVLRRGETAEAALLWRLLVEANGADSVTGPLTVDLGTGEAPQLPGLDVDLGTSRRVTVTAWQRPEGGSEGGSAGGSVGRAADRP